MKSLQVELNLARFASTKLINSFSGKSGFMPASPLLLKDTELPPKPGQNWYRIKPILSGICGSDLATVRGETSGYFYRIVSFPFTLGHEIVGIVQDGDLAGQRVVIESVLNCGTRAIEPMCEHCKNGDIQLCENITFGHIHPGLQIGFCKDTGGGWAEELWAHQSQIYPIPEGMGDEDAVMVEPTACGIHAAFSAGIREDDDVVILGAGTIGLTTLAAVKDYLNPKSITITAKYPIQQSAALLIGADIIVKPSELLRSVRRTTNSMAVAPEASIPSVLMEKLLGKGEKTRQDNKELGGASTPKRTTDISPRGLVGRLTKGADVVIDCIGNASSISQALAAVKPGGKIVLAGMPGDVKVDLAPLWQREISLVGAYGYGRELLGDEHTSTFSLAIDLVEREGLGRLVSAKYPLSRYKEAIAHANNAGARESIKIVFSNE
jgi:threonine dehydrogenase-like Zn-dependent dehydrogenase